MLSRSLSLSLSIRNNRGMNDGKDLSEEYLLDLYTRITCEEMKMLKVNPLGAFSMMMMMTSS